MVSMDDVKVFKVSSENLEDINKAFKNNNYTIKFAGPGLKFEPAKYMIIDLSTDRGFMLNEGATIGYNKKENILYLLSK